MPRVEKQPCACIIASRPNGTLYIGVTSDLYGRTQLHRSDLLDGFTSKHSVHRLVYYEIHATMSDAINREKQLKKWKRLWKIRLIEQMNPTWEDLFDAEDGIASVGTDGQTPNNRSGTSRRKPA